MNFTVLRFDTLNSTNTEAANQARRGADEGLCIVARQQTAGRGRHGRAWVSESDAGLYLSFVLRPDIDPGSLPLITLTTGIAVYDTLKEIGLKPDIKWVNDVLIGDKKICGILAETVETGRGLAVIVGVGVNLSSRSFPEELAGSATSIVEEKGEAPTAADLAEAVTRYVAYFYDILLESPGQIVEHWRQRSTYFSGKTVRVTVDDTPFEGVTDGLEGNGALRVKMIDGSVTIVQAGDVERLRSMAVE